MKAVGKFEVCGLEYTVIELGEGEKGPEGMTDTDEGSVDYKKGRIYLRAGVSKSRQRDTLHHEVLHALLEASGAHFLIQSATQLTGKNWETWEEVLIRKLTPAFVSFLRTYRKV